MPQFTAKVYKGKENFDDAFFIRKTIITIIPIIKINFINFKV